MFLHNRCSFSHCTSTEKGSCIYYQIGSNSSIVQRKFCCTKCQSQKYGQFSSTKVDKNNINFFIESSVCYVGNEDADGRVIDAFDGNIIVSSTNFSSNKSPEDAVGCFSKSSENDFITTFNYSTVVNNLVTGQYDLIYFSYNSLIDSCNIINNTNN